MKELKFTPENLERHLKTEWYKNDGLIYTTRGEIKGRRGDVFYIKDVGYCVLVDIQKSNLSHYVAEGFNSMKEFMKEMVSIYPSLCELYLHILIKIRLLDESFHEIGKKCIDCANNGYDVECKWCNTYYLKLAKICEDKYIKSQYGDKND